MESKPPQSTTVVVASLVARLQAGDPTARAQLIERCQHRIEALAHKYLRQFAAVRQISDTGDVRQVAAMRLMTTLENMTPNDARHFFALTSQQIRWTLLSMCREIERRADGLGAGTTLDPSEVEAPHATRNAHDARLELIALYEALDKLDKDLREVVDLYIIQELPRAEVAELLGISERQVNRLWLRAKVELGRLLTN
jgi:RNA polymerase sigma factor (sigma-70 family)